MGAMGEGGVRILNDEVVAMAGVTPRSWRPIEERERAELERRGRRFRGGRPPVPIAGRTAVVVDDGIATGSTARAACRVARAHGAARIILAVPVAAFRCDREPAPGRRRGHLPRPSHGRCWRSGQWYGTFPQTSDQEVINCSVGRGAASPGPAAAGP